jgi:hypothetical protein
MASKLAKRGEPTESPHGITIYTPTEKPNSLLNDGPQSLNKPVVDIEHGPASNIEENIHLLPENGDASLLLSSINAPQPGTRPSFSERLRAKLCYPRPGAKPAEGYRHVWANFICALSVLVITGIWSVVITWQDENLHFVNPTPAAEDGPEHGGILILPASIALSFIVRNRNWFYLVTLLVNFVCALADPRGNLPGIPILRNFFNPINWIYRIFSILSFINTLYVIYHASSRIIYEASALLVLGWICKFVGQTRTQYQYAVLYAIWQNLCSFSIICVYWYK